MGAWQIQIYAIIPEKFVFPIRKETKTEKKSNDFPGWV